MGLLPPDHWSRTPPPVGTLVCVEGGLHGPVTPDVSVGFPACPVCGALLWVAIDGGTLGRAYMPSKPELCPAGHRYTPGRMSVGAPKCPVHGGHHTWTCRLDGCGATTEWPPRGPGCATPV